MNELQKFNFEGNEVRTVTINDQPYFVGKDVAVILGYKNERDALSRHIDEEDVKTLKYKACRETRQAELWEGNDFSDKKFINESGLYSLIIGSKLPDAKKFKHWVTSEVLPTIRKHGAYMTDEKAFDVVHNANGLADLLQQAADQLKAKDIQIAEMKPKALFADSVATAKTNILIGNLSKIIKQNGVRTLKVNDTEIAMGPNNLFKWLRANKYLISRKGTDYNTPTQRSMELGLFEIKESTHTAPDGHVIIQRTTKVTGKGQIYFINKFLKNAGDDETC